MSDGDDLAAVRPARWRPGPSTLQIAAHLLRYEREDPPVLVGATVRMSADWRRANMRSGPLSKGDRGVWFSDHGPMWPSWTGVVVRIYERPANQCGMGCARCGKLPQTEVVAVVEHAPEDCGCTPYRGRVCVRCDGTFVATRRFARVSDLEVSGG